MRIPLITILFISIAACSTTRIHVHTAGVDQHKQQELRESLMQEGFNVELHNYELPQLKQGSYLVYTPDSQSNQRVQKIEDALSSLNLPLPEQRLFSLGEGISAHSYTKGNIGLYIITNQTQETNNLNTLLQESSVTDWELVSTDCKKSYILEFAEDGQTYISGLDDGVELSELNWKTNGKELILRKWLNSYVYRISEAEKTITPTQKYPEPYGCQYRSDFKSVVQKIQQK